MSGIMLVTDDVELNRVVKAALADTPARVTLECKSARVAAEVFAKAVPTLVILDMFLPHSSGLDMLKTLKKINENCLFVMLTRLRTRNMIERAFRFGAQDVLIYPVDGDVLRDSILHRLEGQPLEGESVGESSVAKPARPAGAP